MTTKLKMIGVLIGRYRVGSEVADLRLEHQLAGKHEVGCQCRSLDPASNGKYLEMLGRQLEHISGDFLSHCRIQMVTQQCVPTGSCLPRPKTRLGSFLACGSKTEPATECVVMTTHGGASFRDAAR